MRENTALRHMSMIAVVLVALATGPQARAEIYRWVDADGRIHFTADLHDVPAAHRRAAEAAAKAPPRQTAVQIYDAPAARSRAGSTGQRSGQTAAPKIHRIRVQSAGGSMRVKVRINDRLDVPFLIDTGATDVVLPQWAASELGLDLSGARSATYATANGLIEQKLAILESVSLAGAVVEQVPASISTSMSEGLLGLSFFNHFKYDVDPVNGLVTLQRNDLAASGVLRGGRSRAQWQQQFAAARARISEAESRLGSIASGHVRKRDGAEEEIAALHHEFGLLESEADDARVPFDWRE